MQRYDRQRRVGETGPGIDSALAAASVLLIGCGGTGSPLAAALVRAGVGRLTILDPDTVSETDLARQTLYFSRDAAEGAGKAERAVAELERIGGRSQVEGHSIALTPKNAAEWIATADLVFDATDHLPARGWIDDACRAESVPWIHLGAIEDRFVVIPFLTPTGPCFRCYAPLDIPIAALGTCETRGVIPAATQLAAAHGFSEFWSWLGGPSRAGDHRVVLRGTVGDPEVRVSTLRHDPDCPSCGKARRDPEEAPSFRMICGKSRLEGWSAIDREALLSRLRLLSRHSGSEDESWEIREETDLVRARRAEERLTLFADGRVIYGPVEDLERSEARIRALVSP